MTSEVPAIRALLVEDDAILAELTARYLSQYQIVVVVASTGPDGLVRALAEPFDVVLLDLMLPGKTGLEVCKALRERSGVPVIMLTARGEEADRILGLEGGADDYLPKPFSARELVARIHAHVRRFRGEVGPSGASALRVGRFALDAATMTATLDGAPLALTTHEYNLLRVFLERPNRVLSREQILELVKGDAAESFDRAVDGSVSRLRQKLGDDPRAPRLLKTVRGLGYFLAVDVKRGQEPT